jgi:hypothetical protein
LERHIEVGGPEFQKLGYFLQLREIEVFERLSKRAVELLQGKSARLGPGSVIGHHHRHPDVQHSPPSPVPRP